MKRIILTGGASGIGLAIARRLVESKSLVHVFDRQESEQIVYLNNENGRHLAFHELDITDTVLAVKKINEAASGMGGIDFLINNAGIMQFENSHDATFDSVRKHLAVNLEAPIHLTAAAVKVILNQESGGGIINIASVAGIKASPKLAVYSAAKAGLIQYTRSIAAEYAKKGIRANAICPGAVETGLTNKIMFAMIKKNIPLGEFQSPEETAALVNYLVSDEARNVTGAVFSLDGGMSL